MLSLLREEFAPTTSSVGFLEAPIDEVVTETARWRRELYGSASTRTIQGGLRTALAHLEPLTMSVAPRVLAIQTSDPSWTAYFDCDALGTDPAGAVSVLCGRMRCRGVIVTCVPQTISGQRPRGRYGAVMFEVREPDPENAERSRTLRAVGAANDGGRWTFYAFGQTQPFEDTKAYERRFVRDRFTSEMLGGYCRGLGIRIFDEDFYRGPSVLIESDVPYRGADGRPPEFTFEQNRERLGIVPGEARAIPG